MNSSNIIALLKENGWVHVRTAGSHHHFKHVDFPKIVTVPHPKKDLPTGTVNQILKTANLK